MNKIAQTLLFGCMSLFGCAHADIGPNFFFADPHVCKTTEKTNIKAALSYRFDGKYLQYAKLASPDLAKKIDEGDMRAAAVFAAELLVTSSGREDIRIGLEQLKRAVSAKDALALYLDGSLRRIGLYLPVDHITAHRDFEEAVRLGLSAAYSSLAADYLTGSGVEINTTLARKYAEQAISNGDSNGYQQLGVIYSLGLGVPVDKSKGYSYSKIAADAGNIAAAWDVSRDYYFGFGVVKDVQEALPWARKAYCGGVGDAGLLIGIQLVLNNYKGDDLDAGVDILKGFAKSGDGNACLVLSSVYLDKRYNLIDTSKGLQLLRCSMLAGIAHSKYKLGASLLRYGSTKADFSEAEALLKSEAEDGNISAQSDLGIAYLRGDELGKNKDLAQYWLRRASDGGDVEATQLLKEIR